MPAPASASAPQNAPHRSSDRKSTRLNSSHQIISYAVFCLKKKNTSLNYSHHIRSYAFFRFETQPRGEAPGYHTSGTSGAEPDWTRRTCDPAVARECTGHTE